MNDEPKKEILSLLESPELREYLMAPPEKLNCTQYAEIICGAPVSLYRKRELLLRLKAEVSEEERHDVEEMLYALTVKEEAIRQLYFYIEELPAEQRRIILLRIEGHSWDEIASRLGVSINTVKTQKSRSYKFLREKLANSSYSVLLTLIFY